MNTRNARENRLTPPNPPTNPPQKLMRSVVTDARKGLEPEYECTSLAGPHCRTHGPTGDLLSDDSSASSSEDGSLLIQLDDTTLGKDGKIDLAKVMEMFGGGVMAKKAREAAAAARTATTNEAANEAVEGGDDEAAVREARDIAAKIGIGRANGVFEMHSPLAAGRRLRPDAVVGRGGEGMASTPSRDDRKVEFINARDATSALYWLDFDGNEVHYVDLPPGMTTMMSTFGSHVWVSRDMATNAAVAAYAVTARKPGEPPVQHFIVTDVDFSDAMAAAAAALMAQDTAEATATGETGETAAGETAAGETATGETATGETATGRRSGDRARIDAEIERRRRRHEAARAAAAARREKLLEEDPLDLRGAAERLERAKSDARALSRQVREAKEEARRRREEREARARDGEEREARDRDDSEL